VTQAVEWWQGALAGSPPGFKEQRISSTPTRQTPPTPPAETVEERFRRLEARWEAATAYSSSSTEITQDPAFQEIIGLGPAVVPFMLRDLEQRPRLWVWALPAITGADPVPAPDRGNIARMRDAWLRWARAEGYQW
jgi:hypothetical protein